MVRYCLFGSAVVRVVADRPSYAEAVLKIIRRQRGASAAPVVQSPTIEIFVRGVDSPPLSSDVSLPADDLVVHTPKAAQEFVTEAVTVDVDPSHRIAVRVSPGFSRYEVRVQLTVPLYKALLYLGFLHLHAAAVEFYGHVNVFMGGRGAGKTSLSLAFASAGAVILGEDGVVFRQLADRFVVSGAHGILRVLPDTEAHFFTQPLNIAPQFFGGREKKELSVADRFTALPNVDRPVDRLFFPRVGRELRVHPLSRSETVFRLIETIRDDHRFGDAHESREMLQYVSALAHDLPAFDVELSPRLGDLNGFVEQFASRRNERVRKHS